MVHQHHVWAPILCNDQDPAQVQEVISTSGPLYYPISTLVAWNSIINKRYCVLQSFGKIPGSVNKYYRKIPVKIQEHQIILWMDPPLVLSQIYFKEVIGGFEEKTSCFINVSYLQEFEDTAHSPKLTNSQMRGTRMRHWKSNTQCQLRPRETSTSHGCEEEN